MKKIQFCFLFFLFYIVCFVGCSGLEQNMFNGKYKKVCDIPEDSKLEQGASPMVINCIKEEYNDAISAIEEEYFVLCGKMRNVDFALLAGHDASYFEKLIVNLAKSAHIPYVIFSLNKTKVNPSGAAYGITGYFDANFYYPMTAKERESVIPGFRVRELKKDEKKNLDGKSGIIIDVVYANSPAFLANLNTGDVITKVNGTEVTNLDSWKEVQKNIKNGDELAVEYLRKNKAQSAQFKFYRDQMGL